MEDNKTNSICPHNITNLKFLLIQKIVSNKNFKFIQFAPDDSDKSLVMVDCCHYKSISYHWFLSITTLMFYGVIEKDEWHKWIKQK